MKMEEAAVGRNYDMIIAGEVEGTTTIVGIKATEREGAMQMIVVKVVGAITGHHLLHDTENRMIDGKTQEETEMADGALHNSFL